MAPYFDKTAPEDDSVGESAAKKRKGSSERIDRWFEPYNPAVSAKIDQLVADYAFMSGLPFTVVTNSRFQKVVKALRPMYTLPSCKRLAGPLLDATYVEMRKEVQDALQGDHDGSARLTLVSDGWTNQRKEHIINYLLVTPTGQAYFHSSEVTGLNRQTGAYLFDM